MSNFSMHPPVLDESFWHHRREIYAGVSMAAPDRQPFHKISFKPGLFVAARLAAWHFWKVVSPRNKEKAPCKYVITGRRRGGLKTVDAGLAVELHYLSSRNI